MRSIYLKHLDSRRKEGKKKKNLTVLALAGTLLNQCSYKEIYIFHTMNFNIKVNNFCTAIENQAVSTLDIGLILMCR